MIEGMLRAYLVLDRLAGFGHQAVNALYPALEGAKSPPAGPRLYSAPDDPRFQEMRQSLEQGWVRMLCDSTGLAMDQLPLLWDADFMLGESDGDEERYVLCEINVSSVSPFPYQGEQNVSSVGSLHSHSLDIGSFNSSGESSHVHSVDIPLTGTSLNAAATVMPYLQLLACRKT